MFFTFPISLLQLVDVPTKNQVKKRNNLLRQRKLASLFVYFLDDVVEIFTNSSRVPFIIYCR